MSTAVRNTRAQEEMVERINFLLNEAGSGFSCVMCLGERGQQGMVVRRMEGGFSADLFVDIDSNPYTPEIPFLIEIYKQALGII